MGRGPTPYQFEGLLCLGSGSRTLVKAKTGDRARTGRMKAQAQPGRKSTLVFETCSKCLFMLRPHNSSSAFCSYFVCQLENSFQFSLKGQFEFTEQAEYFTQVNQFCDPYLVIEMCYQRCLLLWENLCNGSLNSITLVSDFSLDNHFISVYKRRRLCCVSI